jgi:hypothetical protein
MNDDFYIISKYLTKHWDKEFIDIEGYEILYDITLVFGVNCDVAKDIIREWFFEFEIEDKWFDEVITYKFVWSTEMLQDLQAFHGIDVEAQLTTMLAIELSNNINRNIINQMFISVDVANGPDRNNYVIGEMNHNGNFNVIDLPVEDDVGYLDTMTNIDNLRDYVFTMSGVPRSNFDV